MMSESPVGPCTERVNPYTDQITVIANDRCVKKFSLELNKYE